MRVLRTCLVLVLLLLCLVAPVVSQSQDSKSNVKVTDIYPGLLRTGELGTLLISGKNLQHIQYVELRAVSAPKPTGPSTTSVSTSSSEKPIKIKPIDPTKLIVEADLSNIQVAGAYLLSLGSGTDDDHPGIQVVVPINVLGAGQPATSANQSTPVTQGPFASCLTSSPSMLPSSGSQANTGVNCSSSVLTDHEVLDNFGGHVSNVYYAIQVRVSNQNSQYDFLLRDILITLPDGRVVSGRIKRLAQGVVLKGRSEDRRAIAYNVIGAAGTIYGGAVVLPVTATLKNIGNWFQGPLEAAFTQIWPDYTPDNINRFNNAVFDDSAPSIVPKGGVAQPPLYVVALLPKPTGNYPYKTNFIDMVSVGIEGTFIQQVNTVSVSPTGLSFKPEFISPQSYTTVLGSDVNLVALQTASPAQPITLSNQSSSAASITKIKFTASSGGADSNDFQVALDQPNKCETQAIDPSKSFSIPAQQTCQIYIRSTPQTVGNTTATMSVEGANIDTTQTVALTGSGVGFYLDTAANSKSRAPFNCSLIAGKCIIDLGSNNGASTIIPAYVFVGSTGDLCPQITQTAANGAISPQPFTCSALPPIKDKAAFQLNLTLDSNSSSIPLTFKIGDASESITFNYQTLATTTTFTSPPTISHTDTKTPLKVVVQVKGTDQPPSLPPVNSTVKLLIQLGATITPQEATTVQDGTATFSVPLTTAGTYHLSATFEDSGKFAESSTTTQLTVTVTDPTTAAPAQPAPR